MSIEKKRGTLILTSLLFVSFLTVGCDQIKGFFSGDEAEEKVAESTPKTPQQTTKKISTKVVLPADGIARVNDWVLTKEDFDDRLKALKQVLPDFDVTNQEARKMVLDEIVSQQLIVMEAKDKGLNKQKEIASAVDEFEKTLLVRESAKNLVQGITVSEDDARTFYDENPDNFRVQEEWRLREIVVKDQLKANELLLQIMKGEDFAAVAKKNSLSESASNGGDLGFVANVSSYEMMAAIAKLQEGEVSNVFEGPDGYYIMKVEEKRGGRIRDFDEVKEQLRQELVVLEQQKVILDHVEKLKEKADIEIKEENLE